MAVSQTSRKSQHFLQCSDFRLVDVRKVPLVGSPWVSPTRASAWRPGEDRATGVQTASAGRPRAPGTARRCADGQGCLPAVASFPTLPGFACVRGSGRPWFHRPGVNTHEVTVHPCAGVPKGHRQIRKCVGRAGI